MKEIGDMLREERLRRNLSLQALSDSTRMSVKVIEALEAGTFDQIGTPLLIRNFLRMYARALSLDPKAILDQHAAGLKGFEKEQDDGIRRFEKWARPKGNRRGFGLVAVVVLVLAVVAAWGTQAWLGKRDAQLASAPQPMASEPYPQTDLGASLAKRAPEAGKTDAAPAVKPQASPTSAAPQGTDSTRKPVPVETVKSQPGPASAPGTPAPQASVQAPVPAPAPTPAPASKKRKVAIEAEQKTWLRVKVDGGPEEKAFLNPGDRREWETEENFQLTLGNAGGVKVTYDGKHLKPLGKKGRVARVTLKDLKRLAAETPAQ